MAWRRQMPYRMNFLGRWILTKDELEPPPDQFGHGDLARLGQPLGVLIDIVGELYLGANHDVDFTSERICNQFLGSDTPAPVYAGAGVSLPEK